MAWKLLALNTMVTQRTLERLSMYYSSGFLRKGNKNETKSQLGVDDISFDWDISSNFCDLLKTPEL